MLLYFLPFQDQDNETLKEILKTNAEKPVKMLVYSSKTSHVRGNIDNDNNKIIILCFLTTHF